MHRALPPLAALALAGAAVGCNSDNRACAGWMQWAQSSDHAGQSCVAGQAPAHVLAQVPVDPFAAAETVIEGDLRVHYQAPLVVGDDVYVLHKAGDWTPPCADSPDGSEVACHRLDSELWTENYYTWHGSSFD